MPSLPQRLVVFDYNWSGHIPSYHRLVVASALRAGHEVISLSGGPGNIRDFVGKNGRVDPSRLYAPECPNLGRPPPRDSKLKFLKNLPLGYALWSAIRTNPLLRRRHARLRWDACLAELARLRADGQRFDHVFFPYLDDLVEPNFVPPSLGVPWSALYMSASDLRMPALRNGMSRRLRALSQAGCRGIAILDGGVQEPLRAILGPSVVVATLPDAADADLAGSDTSSAAELARRAAGRKIVGLFGHLSTAKNLGMFLKVATEPSNRDLFFVMAGQFEPLGVPPQTREFLLKAAAGAWENIWAMPGRIADEGEFNRLFRTADVVFAVYRQFPRSSNILTKAALFRKPIVVAKGYCMEERVAEYRLGRSVPEASEDACGQALCDLAKEGAPEAQWDRYAADFSHAAFEAKWAAFLLATTASMETPRLVRPQ